MFLFVFVDLILLSKIHQFSLEFKSLKQAIYRKNLITSKRTRTKVTLFIENANIFKNKQFGLSLNLKIKCWV